MGTTIVTNPVSCDIAHISDYGISMYIIVIYPLITGILWYIMVMNYEQLIKIESFFHACNSNVRPTDQCPTIFAHAGRQETIGVVGQDCDADHHLVIVVRSK